MAEISENKRPKHQVNGLEFEKESERKQTEKVIREVKRKSEKEMGV